MFNAISKILFIFCLVFFSFSLFSQPPGDPGGGNGNGPDCNKPNPPASCDCPGMPHCPDNVPLDGTDYLMVIGVAIGIYYIRLREFKNTSSRSPESPN